MKNQNSELPKDWKWVTLGAVCRKVEAVKRKEKKPEDQLIYLDIGGIDNLTNKILTHKEYKWKDAPSRAQQIVSKDDILFSTVRTYMKNIAVVTNEFYDGQIASSGFCVIRSDKKIANSKFVFYYTIEETKTCEIDVRKISDKLKICFQKGNITQDDKDEITILFSEIEINIENLTENMQLAFGGQSEGICNELTRVTNKYWRCVTGGQLMVSTYVKIDEPFYRHQRDTFASTQKSFRQTIIKIQGF